MADPDLKDLLTRIAEALERLAPAAPAAPDLSAALFHRFEARGRRFRPAPARGAPLDLLVGVDAQKAALAREVARFAAGLPANHVLLWGARGAGKSSLVKAVARSEGDRHPTLRLVEVDADELAALPELFETLRELPYRVLVFCDDLSFPAGGGAAKALKTALEGGVLGAPDNVLFLATSNRRHLMPESADETRGLVAAGEDAEETVSLSDRFGVWIGFPPMSQADFLDAVSTYAQALDLGGPDLERRALQWAQRRGGRSGRTAVQFIRGLSAEAGRPLPF